MSSLGTDTLDKEGQLEEVHELLRECSKSLKKHCQVFHGSMEDPHGEQKRFYRPFSRNHEEFFEVWDDKGNQQILCIWHRGGGKTSIFNYAALSQSIMFELYKFIVPVSATATSAVLQSDNLRAEVMQNHLIQAAIGEVKSAERWSKDAWITSNGVLVMPKGRGQQVRGILHRDSRPDLIIPDDLEDDESVQTIEQRRKTANFFFGQLAGVVDRSSKDWRMCVVGTILHEACLLLELKGDPDWIVLEAPLCDDNYKSYWPAFMDNDAVLKLKDQYARMGNLDIFYREYMNQPMAKEDASFQVSMFKYYNEVEEDLSNNRFSETFVIVDPAKTAKVHNAFTAIGAYTIQFSPKGNKIFIRDIENKHLHADEIIQHSFDMARKWGATVIGYEVTGLEEFITQPMKDFMARSGEDYELIELDARKGEGLWESKGSGRGKEARISSLVPYYRNGVIYHNDNGVCKVLEDQLLAFPRSKFVDAADVTAYIIQMLARGERYMTQEMTVDQLREYAGEDDDLALLDAVDEYDDDYDDDESALEVEWR